ncbi:MAG TPA: hypothetical protein VK970_08985, partial [Candidatus Methylacidiphilales bacterium]|nr:hypothetical protein [Candidatus Methylacidiphilales bacterium]
MSAKSNKNAKTRLIDWLGIALLVALAAVLVQATPVKDMFWQGQWQNSANAGGQSITNLGSLTATNTITGRYFVGDGASLTNLPAPASAVQTNRTIATTSPLTGGGDLSTNRTFAFDGTAAFNLSGATNLNASNLASGTVAVARLPVIPA